MRIFYIKHTLFDSSYRCAMVRKRLLKQIGEKKPDYLIVSVCPNRKDRVFNELMDMLDKLNVTVIADEGKHSIENNTCFLSNTHLLFNNKLISPIEGCVSVIETNPYSLNYIVLDIFADESFSDYHGELDERLTSELNDILTNHTK